jgi:hypothetical protein
MYIYSKKQKKKKKILKSVAKQVSFLYNVVYIQNDDFLLVGCQILQKFEQLNNEES